MKQKELEVKVLSQEALDPKEKENSHDLPACFHLNKQSDKAPEKDYVDAKQLILKQAKFTNTVYFLKKHCKRKLAHGSKVVEKAQDCCSRVTGTWPLKVS